MTTQTHEIPKTVAKIADTHARLNDVVTYLETLHQQTLQATPLLESERLFVTEILPKVLDLEKNWAFDSGIGGDHHQILAQKIGELMEPTEKMLRIDGVTEQRLCYLSDLVYFSDRKNSAGIYGSPGTEQYYISKFLERRIPQDLISGQNPVI